MPSDTENTMGIQCHFCTWFSLSKQQADVARRKQEILIGNSFRGQWWEMNEGLLCRAGSHQAIFAHFLAWWDDPVFSFPLSFCKWD